MRKRKNIRRSGLTANGGIFVAAILAVGVPVALPRLVNATTVGLALELQLAAFQAAVSLVALVPAVVRTVADGHARPAVTVRTLKDTGPTDTRRATGRLVRAVLAILLTVAPSIN